MPPSPIGPEYITPRPTKIRPMPDATKTTVVTRRPVSLSFDGPLILLSFIEQVPLLISTSKSDAAAASSEFGKLTSKSSRTLRAYSASRSVRHKYVANFRPSGAERLLLMILLLQELATPTRIVANGFETRVERPSPLGHQPPYYNSWSDRLECEVNQPLIPLPGECSLSARRRRSGLNCSPNVEEICSLSIQ